MPRHVSRSAALRLAVNLLVLSGLAFSFGPPTADAQTTRVAGIVSRIPREPVESRGLAAVGYSKRLRALEIEFRRGGTYRYLGVAPEVYRDLLAAESKARFYNEKVRGKYKSIYVRPRKR